MRHSHLVLIGFLFLTVAHARAADAPDCSTFTWDMTHELALFSGIATSVQSATSAAAAPSLGADTLYAVALHPLQQVTFAHALGKAFPAESSSGGMLKLRLDASGDYRISVDAPLWIDVVASNEVIESTGFQGRQPCRLIHKSVAWTLPSGVDLIVQLAGPALDQAKIAVTQVRSAAADRP